MKSVLIGYRLAIGAALLLSALSVLFSVLLYVAVIIPQQDKIEKQQANICKIQGTVQAGILADLGIELTKAKLFSKVLDDRKAREFYKAEIPSLEKSLDSTFKNPPKCGQRFEFTILIDGDKKRHVVVPGKR